MSTSTKRTIPSFRHLGMVSVLLAAALSCTPAGPSQPAPGERFLSIRPGDARIAAARPTGAECFEYRRFAPDDTTGQVMGMFAAEWGGRGKATWLRTAYATQTEDTMVYDQASLAPSRERLRVGGALIDLRYRGATVERRVQRGDSVQPWHTVTYDRPVFGFNQRELLLRVVRLQPADTLILPLYSEIDAALELDSISLITPSAGLAPSQIQVRFADPAIVATVTIDTLTRRILTDETRNRRRPGRIVRTLRPSAAACSMPADPA